MLLMKRTAMFKMRGGKLILNDNDDDDNDLPTIMPETYEEMHGDGLHTQEGTDDLIDDGDENTPYIYTDGFVESDKIPNRIELSENKKLIHSDSDYYIKLPGNKKRIYINRDIKPDHNAPSQPTTNELIEPPDDIMIEKDIKKLTKDIKKTKIPKSTFKPEIDSMKEKLNNISKKLFNKKNITSLIEDVKKTNTPKSTYKPNIQSLKDTLNVIGKQLKYKKLRAAAEAAAIEAATAEAIREEAEAEAESAAEAAEAVSVEERFKIDEENDSEDEKAKQKFYDYINPIRSSYSFNLKDDKEFKKLSTELQLEIETEYNIAYDMYNDMKDDSIGDRGINFEKFLLDNKQDALKIVTKTNDEFKDNATLSFFNNVIITYDVNGKKVKTLDPIIITKTKNVYDTETGEIIYNKETGKPLLVPDIYALSKFYLIDSGSLLISMEIKFNYQHNHIEIQVGKLIGNQIYNPAFTFSKKNGFKLYNILNQNYNPNGTNPGKVIDENTTQKWVEKSFDRPLYVTAFLSSGFYTVDLTKLISIKGIQRDEFTQDIPNHGRFNGKTTDGYWYTHDHLKDIPIKGNKNEHLYSINRTSILNHFRRSPRGDDWIYINKRDLTKFI